MRLAGRAPGAAGGAAAPGAAASNAALGAACAARLAVLRGLVNARNYEAAVDWSFALDAALGAAPGRAAPGRMSLPQTCRADVAVVGVADVAVTIATPPDRGAAGARATFAAVATVTSNGQRLGPFRAVARNAFVEPAWAFPVAGVVVDGDFVAAESAARCAAHARGGVACAVGHARDVRYADFVAARGAARVLARAALERPPSARRAAAGGPLHFGTKKMLVVPFCSADAADCGAAFNRGLVTSNYGGDVKAYLTAVLDLANNFLRQNSYGHFDVEYTIADPVRADFQQADCKDVDWLGAYQPTADAAALAAGKPAASRKDAPKAVPSCRETRGASGWPSEAQGDPQRPTETQEASGSFRELQRVPGRPSVPP